MRILLSGIVAVLLALSAAGAAEAKIYVHDDSTGDVWVAFDLETASLVPDQVEGDVTSVQLRHNKAYVQLFMSLREIKRETLNNFFYFNLQNGRKKITQVTVGTYPRFGKPDGVLTVRDGRHRTSKCRGTKGFAINWETNQVAVTLPRTCVGDPKYLRMQAFTSFDHDTAKNYSDDALSTSDAFIAARGWTPWVGRN